MLNIDNREISEWLLARGISDASGELSLAGFFKLLECYISTDSGRKTALSRAIALFFEHDDEALLWINEYGVWPSSEDKNLFYGFLRSIGINQKLDERPGYIFSKSDLTNLSSLIALILYFVWGAILYSPAKGLIIRMSHDEFISVFARTEEHRSDVVERLKSYCQENE